MRWLSVLVLLGACVDMDTNTSTTILGTSGDVTMEPGEYVGYRVVMPCEGTYTQVGVIGTGSTVISDTSVLAALGQELGASLADVASVHGYGGYGEVCEPGVGTHVHTNSWLDVDGLIVRAGDFLRERDLAIEIGISVGGAPVTR